MPTGCSQALTGHGAATMSAAALQALAAASRPDDLLRLSEHVSPDGTPVVTLHGDLDLATADRTVRYITDVITRHTGPVRVDLSGLAFCDACGLGALIRIAAYAEHAGRAVELARPSRAATRIMRITGVGDRLLTGPLATVAAEEPVRPAGRG